MWSRQSASTKLRTTKFSSERLGGKSAKFCTNENFPLYGNKQEAISYRVLNLQPRGIDWLATYMYM